MTPRRASASALSRSLATKPFLGCALILFLLLASLSAQANQANEAASKKSKTARLMALTGDEEFGEDQAAWDKTYARKDYVFGKQPSEFLAKHIERLPKGRALDIATGEGRNAVFLAKKGFLVEGVDISAVGLRKAQRLAEENGVKIQTVNADLNTYKIRPNHYEVILNFYYLQRSLYPQIKAGLKSGGIVVFETNTSVGAKPGADRDYLLEPGELKKVFSDFEILHYSEVVDEKGGTASLIARKR